MKPLRLRASAFRSYPELDLAFPAGAVAISGPNGSGKSSLIAALEVALFGARSLGDYLSDDGDADAMWVELTFEHADATYRVRRSFSAKGRGKSTTDLERAVPDYDEADLRAGIALAQQGIDPGLYHDRWAPLTAGTQASTQERLEEILGLSRETLRASALLMQGDAGAFSEAKPGDRKAILSEVVGLDSWPRLLDAARADKRAAERSLAETDGRIALLSERGGDVARLAEAKLRAEEVVADRERAQDVLEAELTAAAEKVTALERAESSYRTAQAAVETARARLAERQAIVDRAAQAKAEAVPVQAELDRIGDPSHEIATLEAKLAEARAQAELRREAESIRDRYLADAEDARRQVATLTEERERVGSEYDRLAGQAEHLALDDATEGALRCPTCEQVLRGEAHATALMRIREARDDAEARLVALAGRIQVQAEHEASRRAAAGAVEIPAPVTGIEALEADLREAREAALAVATARERLRTLEAAIAELTPEVMAEVEAGNVALAHATAALLEIDESEPGALDVARVAAATAKAELDIAARALREARENAIRAESALEQAQQVASELAEAQRRREELLAEIALLAIEERAYGRDGVPAHIVEVSAIPWIETKADRFLSALGTEYRVELRTQRELRSGDGLADTLDIAVLTPAGVRSFETFSGSEQERISIALRLALADLLAHRRGADSRIVVLDEPEGLDEASSARLVELLLELQREGTFDSVYLISHHPALRDVFDSALVVTKEDGRSRVAMAA